jgi:sulfur relay protein TusB/DsrH
LVAQTKLGVDFFVLQQDLDARSLVVSLENMVKSIAMEQLADLIVNHEKSASWF